MAALYPKDPHFDALNTDLSAPPSRWNEYAAHDPSLIEEGGAFYTFSTGNNGDDCYQIRRSADLIHWQYVGQAFPQGIGASLAPAVQELEAVYGSRPRNTTLWAPDVVRGADGKFWLYGCYTAVFGDNYSVLFLARAENVCGPYAYAGTLVVTGGRWGQTPNAIDPQIFYDGGRMYLVYGSFFGGIRALELDPSTGLRKDGLTRAALLSGAVSEDDYYGAVLLHAANAEGPVVHAAKGLPVWPPFGKGAPRLEDRFILMASCGSLFRDYSMRQWSSASPCGCYEVPVAKLTSSCTWRRPGEEGLDFFAPGHNDIFTSSDGRMFVVCHNRTKFKDVHRHYLFVGLAAYNGAGQLVFSLNRYAGERLRPVSAEELCGGYSFIRLTAENETPVYAEGGLLFSRGGEVLLHGERVGEWTLYAENLVDFTFRGSLYRGAAMPAWLEREGRGGITVSAVSAEGFPLYLNGARA